MIKKSAHALVELIFLSFDKLKTAFFVMRFLFNGLFFMVLTRVVLTLVFAPLLTIIEPFIDEQRYEHEQNRI